MKKLTLSLDDKVIEIAKAFSRKSGRSLSSLFEAYLKHLTSKDESEADDPVDELFGAVSFPEDVNEKELVREAIWEREK